MLNKSGVTTTQTKKVTELEMKEKNRRQQTFKKLFV